MINKEIEKFVNCLSIRPENRSIEDVLCIKDFLKTIDDLKSFKDETISEYARIARYEHYESNFILFRRNDVCNSWYIVLSGCVLVDTQKMFLPRNSFGRRIQGSLYRFEECTILEETELIVFDYALDRETATHVRVNKRPQLPISSRDQLGNLNSSTSIPSGSSSLQSPSFFQHQTLQQPHHMVNSKRASHASDTSSSAYSNSDFRIQINSCSYAGSDLEGAGDDENDQDDEEDDDDEGDTSSQDISEEDVFLNVLTKDVNCRTPQDIEVIVSNVKHLAAFSGFTENTRYELCKVMRVANVLSESGEQRLLSESGDVIDTWNVVLEGLAEIRDATSGSVREYGRGTSFGVRPGKEEQYQQGDLWTITPSCIFLCATQSDYTEIVTRDSDTIVPETGESGHTVLLYEKRGGTSDKNSRNVIVKGRRQELLHSLCFDRYKSDMSYMENFLLTYRAFLESPRVLAEKLCEWYAAEPKDGDTSTKETIRKCLVIWANNHFADFDNPNCNMTEYLEKFDEILSENNSTNDKILFNMACRNNSKERKVVVNCSKSVVKTNPIKLVGFEKDYGLFVKEINRSVCMGDSDLRIGDQVLSISNKPWESFENADKASIYLNQTLASSAEISVKYNPYDMQEYLDFFIDSESGIECEEPAVSGNQENLAMLVKYQRSGNRRLSIIDKSIDRSGSAGLQSISDHMKIGLSTMITPMAVPRPHEFSQITTGKHQKAMPPPLPSNLVISAPPQAPNNQKFNVGSPTSKHRSYSVASNTVGRSKGLEIDPSNPGRSSFANRSKQLVLDKKKIPGTTTSQVIKDKKLSSRSCSNPNLKEMDEVSPKSSSTTPGTNKRSISVSSHQSDKISHFSQSRRSNQEPQVIKVFRANSITDSRLVPIFSCTMVRSVMPSVLKEFGIDSAELNYFALYTVTVEIGESDAAPLVKTSMSPPFMRDLAGRLALNQRYYLKNLQTDSSQLITDDQAKVILKESKITLHELSETELATRITQMDYELFKNIQPEEYINDLLELPELSGNSEPEASETNAKVKGFSTGCENFTIFKNHINRQMHWGASELCREPNIQKRADMLKKFFKVIHLCKELKNFSAVYNVFTSINLSCVTRMNLTMEKLGNKYLKAYKELTDLTSMTFNFNSMRQLEKPDVTEYPCIPCLNIHIKDITMIHLYSKTCSSDGLVNFEKLRTIANDIKELGTMCSSEYNLSNIFFQLENRKSRVHKTPDNTGTMTNASVAHSQSSNQHPHNLSLDESDATSGISGTSSNTSDKNTNSSALSGITGAASKIAKARSNSVDHPVLNGTLKKRSGKRKSLNLSDGPAAGTVTNKKKIYEEWLMTLKVKTYLFNVDIETDSKKLHDMSKQVEPPPNANFTSSSNNLSAESSKKSSTSSKIINLSSPTKSPPDSSPKTSVTSQDDKSPVTTDNKKDPTKSTENISQPIQMRASANKNRSFSNPSQLPTSNARAARPPSIFTQQFSATNLTDSDKNKNMIYYCRRQIYKQNRMNSEFYSQQRTSTPYTTNCLQPNFNPNSQVVQRIKNPSLMMDVPLQHQGQTQSYNPSVPMQPQYNAQQKDSTSQQHLANNQGQTHQANHNAQFRQSSQGQNYYYPTANSSGYNSNIYGYNQNGVGSGFSGSNSRSSSYMSHQLPPYFNCNQNLSGPGSTCSTSSNNTNISNSSNSNVSGNTNNRRIISTGFVQTNSTNNQGYQAAGLASPVATQSRIDPPAYDQVLSQRTHNTNQLNSDINLAPVPSGQPMSPSYNFYPPNNTAVPTAMSPVSSKPPMAPPSYNEFMNKSQHHQQHHQPAKSQGHNQPRPLPAVPKQAGSSRPVRGSSANQPPPPPPPPPRTETIDYQNRQ